MVLERIPNPEDTMRQAIPRQHPPQVPQWKLDNMRVELQQARRHASGLADENDCLRDKLALLERHIAGHRCKVRWARRDVIRVNRNETDLH